MKITPSPRVMRVLLVFLGTGQMALNIHASNLDTVGVTLLQTVTTNVNGAGVHVAQPEAADPNTSPGTNTWEVNPAVVGQPTNVFIYISSAGSNTTYPNSLGFESHHAEQVAGNFYGVPGGVATNVAHVDNFEADYFFNLVIASNFPPDINDPVVNQSFIFTAADGSHVSASDQQGLDSAYDNYAAQYNTLFISGAGNGAPAQVNPPATCYNGIGVGVSDGSSSIGPTIDNGRAKPDLIAPGGATSFSTPFVSGAAAVLMQAGLRGDGGSSTNSAANIRTVKALLLNGAIKPADWTNNAPSPLDTRYGAGVLNVFNSYKQLTGGKHGYTVSEIIPSGNPHPPNGDTGTVSTLSGWDFNSILSISNNNLPLLLQDGVNHYYFNVTNGVSNATFTATITLVWNRQQNQTNINNLDLFLYNTISSNLITCSTSLVDNVEHIFIPHLPQGRYDLQVLKHAGNSVSDTETYALAFEFFSLPLNISPSGTNTTLSWPIYPAGFVLESTTNLTAPIFWSTNYPSPVVTNNQNWVVLNATNHIQFFRLWRP